jgi:hypothetical protein
VLLHRDLDGPAVVGVARVRRRDDDDALRTALARGVEHPVDDALSEQRVQVLRNRGLHPGAETAGHDHSCEIAHG